jgi:hypothetical protein
MTFLLDLHDVMSIINFIDSFVKDVTLVVYHRVLCLLLTA